MFVIFRYEERISTQSNEIKILHLSKSRSADEKMQGLLKEISDLKTALTNESLK